MSYRDRREEHRRGSVCVTDTDDDIHRILCVARYMYRSIGYTHANESCHDETGPKHHLDHSLSASQSLHDSASLTDVAVEAEIDQFICRLTILESQQHADS